MKCYYEELGVARDATEADIKTAYRKLALRWHPDKNPDCLDAAKERFLLIQQAYEVLSDPHERAWYDNHREQILRGKNSNYEENCLDLFQYFTVSCFKGYGDDANGFYATFKEIFKVIASEDVEFMDDDEELAQIPQFGDSKSSYEEVVGPFYAHWSAYCTKKTYTWLCQYDIQEIKDRRILREIEKDLKKVVQKARRERNEEVRNLVSFVRKRDKRVHAYKALLEERAALNRQKQEQNRLEQIRKRQRELEEMRLANSNVSNEGYEEQLKLLERQYGDDSSAEEETSAGELDVGEGEEEEEYYDDLYCVACNKSFKNEKAFGNHESSKKHRENVEFMKQQMQDEDEAFRDTDEESEPDSIDAVVQEEPKENGFNVEDELDIEALELSSGPEEDQEKPKETKKNRKSKKSKKANKTNASLVLDTSDQDDEVVHNLTPHAKDPDTSDVEDWNGATKKSVKKNKNKKQAKKTAATKDLPENPKLSDVTDTEEYVPEFDPPEVKPILPFCITCGCSFPSKNKLFAHLKLTNHGVRLPKPPGESPEINHKKPKAKAKGKRK